LSDDNAVEFDFGPRASDDDASYDFSGQSPVGPCPKCGARVFETPNAYVCERAVGEGRSCDFRSGRTILQRPIDPAQMAKLLTSGKTDLLQFVSARTRRPFSAYLVKQADGKVGFEFEAKEPGRRGTRPVRGAPLRVLGKHPRDRQPVELHAGRYGPYVKHGAVNATLPDRDAVSSLSLEQAVALVDAKAGRTSSESGSPRRARTTRETASEAAEAPVRRVTPARGARATERGQGKNAATARTATAKKSTTTKRVRRTDGDGESQQQGKIVRRKSIATRGKLPAASKSRASANARKSKRR
jgi:DNA topoisomerase-3